VEDRTMNDNAPQASLEDVIPTLDIGAYLAGEAGALEALGTQLQAALENVGFYILVNHGIPFDQIERTFEAVKRFHDLPLETKSALRANEHNVGYMAVNTSVSRASQVEADAARKPNLVEAFFVKRDLADDHPDVLANKLYRSANQWPDPADLPQFRETVVGYCTAMEALCRRLLPVYALALDLPADFFDAAFEAPQFSFRMSHYPPSETGEDDQFGVSAHTDSSFLTMLSQADLPGLEVKLPGRDWQGVEPPLGCIVVNSGDLLRRWTNHRFLSTRHRAINRNAGRDRYAIPFFFDASADYPMACLPTCQAPDNPPRYEPITYTDYMKWFTRRNYDHVRERDGTDAADPGVPKTQSDHG